MFAPGELVAIDGGQRPRWAWVRFQVGRFVRIKTDRGGVRTVDVGELRTPEQVRADRQRTLRRWAEDVMTRERVPISDRQRRFLRALDACTFLPGSWAKRFVRDLQGAEALTPRQAVALEHLAFRYRRQILGKAMARHIDASPREHRHDLFLHFFENREMRRQAARLREQLAELETWHRRSTGAVTGADDASVAPPEGVSVERWSDYNRKFNDLLMGRGPR